ncbi:MAG: type I glyceraldehyde-3-phosphate dehydrogenase [Thermofilaceae archaeon]|nr:type I glyceraldehyde-3-phosphate dehydrogenase [Thermofilaceae archaeon]MCX8181305.1 type I glyceraldehyde-3-phosphate dehydrogenase [Thermofilaceae archaeon]MDW8004648.1 type I glyceraldehyde-3-phosphate dehydrogenase [Thermofilaceae archaeon]
MTYRLGINGFGRIGRLFLRAALKNKEFFDVYEVVAVNDLGNPKMLAYLLKYDSTFGKLPNKVEAKDNKIIVDGREILVLNEPNPEKLPWKSLGVDVAMEATGRFTDRDKAALHIKAGAKKVLVTAPSKGADVTIVMGVNHETYNPSKHEVVSNASCTTNCLAPIAYVLLKNFGIKWGFMTTVHAYTNDQRVLDLIHPEDFRRTRAAGVNIIPTTTGAARALHLVIPELKGKMDGMAMRVPVADVSVVDLVAELEKEVSKAEMDAAFKQAAETYLKGILEYVDEPIVSSDILGNPHSSIYDAQASMVLGEKNSKVKVIAWYDNEWGFSCRLVDLLLYMAKKGL